jgi:hypothetical protein
LKALFITLTLAFFSNIVEAKKTNEFFLDAGVGVEYGGIGTQVHLPFNLKQVEAFMSVGLFAASSQSGGEVGAGAGMNYFLDKNNSLSLYYGVLNIEKYLTDTLEVKTESDYGVSLGYKYFFSGKNQSGFSLGVSYNIYADDNYPFFSIGYRY